MTVKRLRQVYLAAADMTDAVRFCIEGLGLELQFQDGENWAQFGAGDVSFALAGEAEAAGAAPGTAVPVFEVEHLGSATNRAEAAGAKVIATRDMGDHGRMATLSVPSGALIALMER